ncbi:MAG: geranylgeranylglycerol-phosphate geranylgeranyltransferase [Chitinophagaceae bacterium]
MKPWLRLVRWPNLLIIAMTQFVAWWCILHPLHHLLSLHFGNFLLLCTSTVLIAAAGYIINDYWDIRIDAINKPEKVILERDIPRRLAIIVHWVLNAIALVLVAFIAFPAGHFEWLMLQLFCIGMLWRYSTTWKRQFAIGNVVVALMTALTIISLIVYEPLLLRLCGKGPFLSQEVLEGLKNTIPNPSFVLFVFAGFAFLLTWMREIVKDMEDYKGDDAEGCLTLPIRWGLLKSTRFVQALGFVAILVLAIMSAGLWRHTSGLNISALYLFGAVIVPLIFLLLRLPKGVSSTHYHWASTRLKLIMVSGILGLLLLHLINYE